VTSKGPVRNWIRRTTVQGTVFQGRDFVIHLPDGTAPAMSGLQDGPRVFTGRDVEMGTLLKILAPHADLDSRATSPSAVAVVTGMGGIGKTALALQTANTVLAKGWFPGGVLSVNMYGYDRERRVDPSQALGGFLGALGIPPERVPPAEQDRARLYASELRRYGDHQRRVLVLIDNVDRQEQAELLLPPGGIHAAIITSRHPLSRLHASSLDLKELAPEAAVEMMQQFLFGDSRIDDCPGDAAEIARLCGGLPLALEITAGLLADAPDRPLSEMAADLHDERNRLDELRYEDRAVRAAFDLSYQHLDPASQHLFRLLSVNPGPDISTQAAVILTDAGRENVLGRFEHEFVSNRSSLFRLMTSQSSAARAGTRRTLEDLARAHLIERSTHGRWRMHDLVRLFASERSRQQSRQDNRELVLSFLLLYYLAGTLAASAYLDHGATDADTRGFGNEEEALNWLDIEYRNLIAAVYTAGTKRRHVLVAMQLPLSLFHVMLLRRRFEDALAISPIALRAARYLKDRHGEATALRNTGAMLARMRRSDEAITAMQQALGIYRMTGDREGQGTTLGNLGGTFVQVRRFDEAISCLQEAIQIHRDTGARYSEAAALCNYGAALVMVDRLEDAINALRASAQIFREVKDQRARANALGSLGTALAKADRHEEAITAYKNSAALARSTGSRDTEASALANLGQVLIEVEEPDDAISSAQDALEIFRDIDDRHGEAETLTVLGRVLRTIGRYEDAIVCFQDATKIHRASGDLLGEGSALSNLWIAQFSARHFGEALTTLREAARIYHTTGDRFNAANLRELGIGLLMASQPDDAASTLRDAVRIYHDAGDRPAEALALTTLGSALQEAYQFEEAIAAHEDAISIFRGTGDRSNEGMALANLGITLRQNGRFEEAITALRNAAQIFRNTGDEREGIALADLETAQQAQRAAAKPTNFALRS
jgi:tetratricopeptide (TPR) repeat protein